MKKIFFLTIFVFLNSLAFAKYYPGKIYLNSGEVIEAKIEPPLQPTDKQISYTAEKKLLKIESNLINSLSIILQDQKVVFVYRDVGNMKGSTKKCWAVLQYGSDWMNVYCTANKYEINKFNQLNLTTSNGNFNHEISFYLIKKGENQLYKVFDYNDGLINKKDFNDKIATYCEDEPLLVKSIRNDEFSWKDLYKLAEVYNTLKKYKEVKKEKYKNNKG